MLKSITITKSRNIDYDRLVKYPIQLHEIIKTDMFIEKLLWHSWKKFIFALAVSICNMLLKLQNYLRGFCNQFKKLFWKLFKTIILENNSCYTLRLTKPSPNGAAASNKWRVFYVRFLQSHEETYTNFTNDLHGISRKLRDAIF